MGRGMSEPDGQPGEIHSRFQQEVQTRLGTVPNFFRLATAAPEVTAALWGFTKSTYLDNPLPPLFKERLFVYLSRFCQVRYCIARHVGFLIGLGRPSGDERCQPQCVDQVLRLLRRPLPQGEDLIPLLALLASNGSPLVEPPDEDSPTEEAIFACATHVFLQTPQAAECQSTLRSAFDPAMFEYLLALLTFVRTAHFWTQTHPELECEEDIRRLLEVNEALAECVLKEHEVATGAGGYALLAECESLRRELSARANADQREAQRQISATLDSIIGGFMRFDQNWRLVCVNSEAERINGRRQSELLGKTLWDLWTGAAGTKLESEFRRAVAEQVTVEFENFYDPWKRWFSVKALPTARSGLAVYFNDITDRKRAEQALRASEEKYRTLFESIDEGFCIIEFFDGPHGPLSDYIHVEANNAYTTNAGIPNIVGQKVREMVPDEADDWVKIYRNVLMTGEPVRFERELIATGRHLDLAAFRIEPPERRQVAVLFKDITQRKQAEEKLREADRRKDEFLATLAHELRNPLAPIRNSLHILKLAGSDSGAAARVQDMLERQVNHMVRLVDDLMEVSRITRGKIELRKEHIELAAVVCSAVETSKPLIEAANHQLAISLPPDPVDLDADPVRLAQVLANLLNNAAKYTEDGGQIWLSAHVEETSAVVSVRDNGTGIRADMLPKIFDLFIQADRTYDRAQGGLGIGLTLVRSLVEMHGGTVEARSAGLGQGSEFVVRLPLARRHIASTREHHTEQLAAVAPLRILVVDDHRDSANSLGMLLKFLGADVHVCNDGPAALQALKTHRPAVVLLDIGMPGMDGYQVAQLARQQPECQNVTFIALTGWGQEKDRQLSSEAGFDHHLVKPVDLDALQKLLTSLPQSVHQ